MKTKLLLLSLLILGLIAVQHSTAPAQKLMDYTVSKTYDNPYVPISGGNILLTNPYMYTYSFIYETDSRLGGFQFKYEDVNWNRFGVLASGIVTLHSTNRSPTQCGPYTWPYYPIHYYYNDHNYLYGNMNVNMPAFYVYYSYYATNYYQGTGPSYVQFLVEGTAPSRRLIIEWTNARPYDINYYNSNCYLNFQLVLHETTGVFEYKYGPKLYTDNFYYNYYDAGSYWYGYTWYTVGATGCDWVTKPDGSYGYYEYINIYSNDGVEDLAPHYTNKNPEPWYGLPAIRDITTQRPNAAAVAKLAPGLIITFSAYPSVVDADPKDVVLRKGQIYTDDNSVNPPRLNHPAVYFNRNGANDKRVRAKYKIEGPLPKNNPDYRVIYTACEPGNTNDEIIDWPESQQPVGKGIRRTMPSGKGLAARSSDGALDLQTNSSQIPGGEYVVKYEIVLNDDSGNPFYSGPGPQKTFYIALDDDIAIVNVKAPKLGFKYPYGELMPHEIEVRNIGINPVSGFYANMQLIDPNGTVVNEPRYVECNPALTTGQTISVAFSRRTPVVAGKWTVVFTVTLDGARDLELSNNRWPRTADVEHYFIVAHEIEAQTLRVINPENIHAVDKPIKIIGEFQNNGVADISNAPVRARIYRMPGNTLVSTINGVMPDIPSGSFNIAAFTFPTEWTPTVPGDYKICISVNLSEDPLTSNNEYCHSFTIVEGLQGVYTVGYEKENQPRNFTTLQDASDAMYKFGIDGPITFELTDATYNVGIPAGEPGFAPGSPALDLSAKIIGVSQTNTITFKPSRTREAMPGGISLTLNSSAGIGIYFGQNTEPYNPHAAVFGVRRDRVYLYANSEGYITFDGGPYKAFRFKLRTDNEFRAPIYLGTGAKNITIKNCRIENDAMNPSRMDHILPMMVFDQDLGRFRYEDDVRKNSQNEVSTYSAGIIMRSHSPYDGRLSTNNNIFIDTIANNNNVIMNNEINGFGYGIVCIGIGPLFKYHSNIYWPYYNDNNIISGNKIWNVARAGIFAGYTKNTKISNNRIYNVLGTDDYDAAGIILGGDWRKDWYGYNNYELTIDGNEISNVSGAKGVFGIKVEQARMSLPATAGGYVYYPSGDEKMIIANNTIWGLAPANVTTQKVGIAAYTDRARTPDGSYNYLYGIDKPYLFGSLKIGNNTIIVGNDQLANQAPVAGVVIQSAKNAELYNNAISFEDNNLTSDFAAAVVYVGRLPKDGGLKADRNAYWVGNTNASIYRYVETDENHNVIDLGNKTDYPTLDQWKLWTGQEKNSVYGNFTTDMAYTGQNPMKLRVKVSPEPPTGSILNNRGEKLSWVKQDIDLNARGNSGQRYDIGAVEFNGKIFVNDLEVLGIYEPGAYKNTTGEFSDAEYVMTREPVKVTTRIRNNGSMAQQDVEVKIDIYMQRPDGSYPADPSFTDRELINVPVGEEYDVEFDLIGLAGERYQFKTYGDLRSAGYVVPDRFKTMEANVTPLYKMVITLQYDQLNANNTFNKNVRLFLARSNMSVLITAENSNAEIAFGTPTVDQIAGKLNFDKLIEGMTKLGWQVNIPEKIYDYDVLERTGWDPKAVNYGLYRSVMWSDADDKPLTRYQRLDLNKFLFQNDGSEKKNLLIASQEMARENTGIDNKFVNDILRVYNVIPGNPMGAGVSNDGNKLFGINLARGSQQDIVSTKYVLKTPSGDIKDAEPYCALVSTNSKGSGLSKDAFSYKNHPASKADSVMGSTLTSQERNTVYLGTDWRHFGNIELIIRALVDFVETNGSVFVAAELLDFNARQAGEKVELTWTTASEKNSSRFDVERSEISSTGRSEFTRIDGLQAAGTSTSTRHYGPVIDGDVNLGGKYAYRLKMVDRDGEFEYSPERIVLLTGDNGIATLSEALPNPSSSEARFNYSLNSASNLKIALYDVTGKQIQVLYEGMQSAGNNEIKVDVKSLPSGIYTVVFSTGNVSLTRNINVIK